MRSIPRHAVPVAIADGGLEVRVLDQDGLMVGFVRLPAGAHLRPATKGLPDDLCPCPHWGYMLKGRVRMHTTDGHQDFAAGEAFYWAAGHAPEALETWRAQPDLAKDGAVLVRRADGVPNRSGERLSTGVE